MVAADAAVKPEGTRRGSSSLDEGAVSKHGELRAKLTNVVADAVLTSSRMSSMSQTDMRSASRLRPDTKLQLHGRDDDVKALRSKLRELAQRGKGGGDDGEPPARQPEMLLVRGVSGAGKSALVNRGLRDPAKRTGAAFAAGKFDQNKNKLPLSAVAQALASLAAQVAEHKSSAKIRKEISEALGDEDMALVSDALPGVDSMLQGERRSGGLKKKSSSRSSVSMLRRHSSARLIKGQGTGARLRLQYAVRRLLKVVCSNLEKGLVLFLDDLQWADTASLEMLTRIALDRDIPSILLVGAYREDEVSDSHPLSFQLKEGAQLGINTTTMSIGNLDPDHVKSLVADVLSMEDYEDEVATLAATVHKKTDGNVFYVLLFLRSLAEDEILQYNFGIMRWRWDDEAVKAKLVTQNVATVMVSILRSSLNEASQEALKVAACLGTSFSPSVVSLAMQEQDAISSLDTDSSERSVSSDISDAVDELEEAGLLERESDEVLRFAHDQVQSSSLDLIPENERVSFRSRLGSILIQKLDPDSLEDNLFEVVSLRNSSIETVPDDERISMAKLNLKAGMKAAENGAFDTAETYFKAGRELLGAGGWEEKTDMMVQLYSEGANACFVCGDFDTMNVLIDEVLAKDISIEVKYRAYEVKIFALTAASDWPPIIDIGMHIRRELGLSVMKNRPVPMWKILKEYLKTDRLLKNITSDEIVRMPQLEDKKMILGQRVLERILPTAYHGQPTMMPLMVFEMVRTSVQHGNNASACIAYASMAMLYQCIFGNPSKASDLAMAADQLLNSSDVQSAGRIKSRAIQICYCFVHHWNSPIHETLAPFIDGYQAGLYSGDAEATCYNLSSRSIHLFSAGRPLAGLQHELESFASVCAQLNQSPAQNMIRADLISVRKLRDVDQGEDSFEAIASNGSDVMIRAKCAISRMELFVFFQDWTSASQLLCELEEDPRAAAVGSWVYVRYTFLESLVSFKAAQASSSWATKRRWKKRGVKLMKQLAKWISKGGNPNIVHSLHMLTAEHAVIKGNHTKAKESFKKAALVATTNGFVQDKGLANALAGAYYAGQGDQYWADYHGERSQEAFREWGAKALVTSTNAYVCV